eukprot:GGOE01061200.1.p1 GENE.GGOE01061200.1~~GGOE01061200.1.p1  ORF type:complete len:250 (+),score=76.34 GGOE01061200.1:28-750(+)
MAPRPEWDAELGVWKGGIVPWTDEDAAALPDPLYVFGYGSLCWNPSFPFDHRCRAHVEGLVRRFWQLSTDHRGTPEFPGLVMTLVSNADLLKLQAQVDGPQRHTLEEAFTTDSCTHGVAYRIPKSLVVEEVRRLDVREQGGYSRCVTDIHLHHEDGTTERVPGLVYLGQTHNPHFSPLSMEECADRIARAHGPSGSNSEYLYRLRSYFLDNDIEDEYITALTQLVRQRDPKALLAIASPL